MRLRISVKHLDPNNCKNVEKDEHKCSDINHSSKGFDDSAPDQLNLVDSGDHIERAKDSYNSEVLDSS